MKLPAASPVFEAFWRFAAERHAIHQKRAMGLPGPWTTDPILRAYKFTNAYRVLDRVTQTMLRDVLQVGRISDEDIFLRVLLYKVFNRETTWPLLLAELHEPSAATYGSHVERLAVALSSARSRGTRIYSSAYIIPPVPGSHKEKHWGHLELIRSMLDDGLPDRIRRASGLDEVYRLLHSYPGIGDFLAFQFAIDLNYTDLTPFDEDDFVMAGPGAKDGISKCFPGVSLDRASEIIMEVYRQQDDWFCRYDIDFSGLAGRPLMPIDVQNVFCEISKYARVAFPNTAGVAGRTRIKQLFKPTGPLPEVVLPAKWKRACAREALPIASGGAPTLSTGDGVYGVESDRRRLALAAQ